MMFNILPLDDVLYSYKKQDNSNNGSTKKKRKSKSRSDNRRRNPRDCDASARLKELITPIQNKSYT